MLARASRFCVLATCIGLGAACSSESPQDRSRTVAASGSTQGGSSVGGSSSGVNGGSGGGTSGTGIVILPGDGGSTGGPAPCNPDSGQTCSCGTTTTPYCGDGMVNGTGEECDDGNALPGDGCTGVCKVEPNFTCPPQGGTCTSTVRCGDGVLSPGEACDDKNTADGDGCSADCKTLEPGWYCPQPGMACERSTAVCGDGRVQPGETCDDANTKDADGCSAQCRLEAGFRCTQAGKPCQRVSICGNGAKEDVEECDDANTVSGDGCSSTCHVEPGYVCATPGQKCKTTVCGNGMREGAECCDDGNTLANDGCTADCRCEPVCPVTGPCTAKCGNGIVESGELCDDGNVLGGDGCSATCQTEKGFTCQAPQCEMKNGKCTISVPVVYRDFNAMSSASGHPDFQPGYNSAGVALGLVQTAWDANKKPVLSGTASVSNGFMHTAADFNQWYRSPDELTGSRASARIPGSIVLWDTGAGAYVNRWGPNGEQWMAPQNQQWCSDATCADPNCQAPPAGTVCGSPCPGWGNKACYYSQKAYDGNPLFFPIDPGRLVGADRGAPAVTILTDTRLPAKVPDTYGFGWTWEPDVAKSLAITTPIATATAPFPSATHNFHFTTEVKWWFRYQSTTPMTLTFTGDDDVWVFVNGKLAVDLGGWHVPTDGTVTIGPTTAATYGLTNGSVYTIGIFQAERETDGSTFKLTLSGFSLQPSKCTPTCGDGIVTVFEECDNGAANSDAAYNGCRANCTFGPRCGDTVVQTDFGEECDDGINIGGYNQCAVGCKLGPRCGDGVRQGEYGELCDEGADNGQPGHCTTTCGMPAFCGDGAVQAPEVCDNGVNDNSYGGCSPDCRYGPRCGDGVVQAEGNEDCDLGPANDDNAYGGCTTRCHYGPHCGDGIVQEASGEECDPKSAGGTSTTVTNACGTSMAVCNDACKKIMVH